MKPVVVFVITFVVAAAASTGAKVMTTKPSHAAADSTKADSTAKHDSTSTDTAAVASGEHVMPPTDTSPRAPVIPGDSSKPVVADTKHGATDAKASARDPKAAAARDTKASAIVASAPRPNADTASERRLSKVFTSMEAKQAAKVLEHMADMDVHIILGYVGPRQAASIMAELPPERVAKLSKIAMNGGAR